MESTLRSGWFARDGNNNLIFFREGAIEGGVVGGYEADEGRLYTDIAAREERERDNLSSPSCLRCGEMVENGGNFGYVLRHSVAKISNWVYLYYLYKMVCLLKYKLRADVDEEKEV
ncbi:MAG: hypothetical protein A2W23_09535 [Planctomycetes bacterium RBG_16_43_13]|nr:MAG: hypothetical protein A2W23_09535 [Planctomycetes bacterium RBG_16_43_13]